jgi:hypothetical protein
MADRGPEQNHRHAHGQNHHDHARRRAQQSATFDPHRQKPEQREQHAGGSQRHHGPVGHAIGNAQSRQPQRHRQGHLRPFAAIMRTPLRSAGA